MALNIYYDEHIDMYKIQYNQYTFYGDTLQKVINTFNECMQLYNIRNKKQCN